MWTTLFLGATEEYDVDGGDVQSKNTWRKFSLHE